MPTYDYQCRACGHEFEKFQSITAEQLRKCPLCGKRKLKRLIGTGAGIIFKGSGFYQTDYRSDSYRKAAEKDKPSDGTSADKAASKDKTSDGASADKAAPKDKSKKADKGSPDKAAADS